MKAARFLTPLLVGATLILLVANAFPTVRRKHRLIEERDRLIQELRVEQLRGRRLREHVEAARNDRFYLQRVLAETWRGVPQGAIVWQPGKEWD